MSFDIRYLHHHKTNSNLFLKTPREFDSYLRENPSNWISLIHRSKTLNISLNYQINILFSLLELLHINEIRFIYYTQSYVKITYFIKFMVFKFYSTNQTRHNTYRAARINQLQLSNSFLKKKKIKKIIR